MVATARARRWALSGLAVASVVLVLGACRAEPAPSPAATSGTATSSVACAETGLDANAQSAWLSSGPEDDVVAIVVSSQVSVGPSRFLYTLTTPGYEAMAAEDLRTELRLYALDRDTEEPAIETEGTYLDTGTGRGVYRAAVEFPCHGTWGAEIVATTADGDASEARTYFRVRDAGTTPAVGAPAPRSDSLTADTMEQVRRISTDPEPDPFAYAMTVAEVVTSGQPSVVFFATPAFCQSGVCGPTVDMVKDVMAGYRGRIGFVNVEPYVLREGPNGLEPELDEQGRLQPVPAAVDYGIPVEPYLFVVDAAGDVAAKFEVVVDEQELRAALEDVLGSVPVVAAEGGA